MTCRWAKGKFPPRQPSEQRPRFAYDIFTEVEHVYGTPPRCLPFVITGREETVADSHTFVPETNSRSNGSQP